MKKRLKFKKIIASFLAILLMLNINVYPSLASNIVEDRAKLQSNEIITDSDMTEEEIDNITNQYPGIIINPSSLFNTSTRAIVPSTLLVTILTKSGVNYKLTATNTSIKGTSVTNTFLVTQEENKTNDGVLHKKAIQRPNGTLSPGQSVSEIYGGWSVYYNLQSITFFAYGTANGVRGYTTPIVVK